MPAELVAVDALLDDPRFFEPFRQHFSPVWGRPSIPIETYLRLMFLKYRYRLGYETLCAEVTDSLSWLRFARIPIGHHAPHPSTLMKITTRCGPELIEELNAALIAKAVHAGVVEMDWLRADTTVVPADIKYPTDSGLMVRGITKAAGLVARIQAAGVAPRTDFDDTTAVARQAAHRIGSKLRRRSEEAKADVLAINGELTDLAEALVAQGKRVLANARRAGDRPVRRLRRMLADLDHVLEDGSSIVFIGSLAADRPGTGAPAYDASKAAVGALARYVAKEGAVRGIRANVVAPGIIDTPLARRAAAHRGSHLPTPVPLGRYGTATEVAAPVAFLLSEYASYITGETLHVDGGLGTL